MSQRASGLRVEASTSCGSTVAGRRLAKSPAGPDRGTVQAIPWHGSYHGTVHPHPTGQTMVWFISRAVCRRTVVAASPPPAAAGDERHPAPANGPMDHAVL